MDVYWIVLKLVSPVMPRNLEKPVNYIQTDAHYLECTLVADIPKPVWGDCLLVPGSKHCVAEHNKEACVEQQWWMGSVC